MKRLVYALLSGLVICGTVSAANDRQGKGNKHAHQGGASVGQESEIGVHVAFGSADVAILRTHYGSQYRNLPPGLQKKLARGGQLPPGWQKKFGRFPVAVERQLAPLPVGYTRGVIDGRAVIFNSRTHVIVDVAVLF